MNFGDFFKEKRLERVKSLRQFCKLHEYDPGNISKLERNKLLPPQSEELLFGYAKALGIKKTSADYEKMLTLAREANNQHIIPELFLNLRNNKNLLNKLPILFRTLDNDALTEEKLDHVIENLTRELSAAVS